MTTLTRNTPTVLEGGPLNAETVEAVYPEIMAPSDPTGGAAPEFALTETTDLAGADWQAGQWLTGSWQERTRSAVAETPTIGGGADLAGVAGTNYLLWCRPQGGSGPVVFCGVVPFQ